MNKIDQRFRTKETHTHTKKEEKDFKLKGLRKKKKKDSVQEKTTMEVDFEKRIRRKN